MRNFGIRYYYDNQKYDWIPRSKLDMFLWHDKSRGWYGAGKHEYVPKDYIMNGDI